MFSINNIISREKLSRFCYKNHIEKLSLFGSAIRDELKQNSDIDLLVEFKNGCVPSLLNMADIEIELTKMIGRKVDLRTPKELSRFFRDEVLSFARVEYAR